MCKNGACKYYTGENKYTVSDKIITPHLCSAEGQKAGVVCIYSMINLSKIMISC